MLILRSLSSGGDGSGGGGDNTIFLKVQHCANEHMTSDPPNIVSITILIL